MYKIGDIVTCTNVVDYRRRSRQVMHYIHLGHKYKVLSLYNDNTISIEDIVTKNRPGAYSTIFFSKEIVLSNHIKVL